MATGTPPNAPLSSFSTKPSILTLFIFFSAPATAILSGQVKGHAVVIDGFRYAVVDDGLMPITEVVSHLRPHSLPVVCFGGNQYEFVDQAPPIPELALNSSYYQHKDPSFTFSFAETNKALQRCTARTNSTAKADQRVFKEFVNAYHTYKDDMERLRHKMTLDDLPKAFTEQAFVSWVSPLLARINASLPGAGKGTSLAKIASDNFWLQAFDLALRDCRVEALLFIANCTSKWRTSEFLMSQYAWSRLPVQIVEPWPLDNIKHLSERSEVTPKVYRRFKGTIMRVLVGFTSQFPEWVQKTPAAELETRLLQTIFYLYEIETLPIYIERPYSSLVEALIFQLPLSAFTYVVDRLALGAFYLSSRLDVTQWMRPAPNVQEKLQILVERTGLVLNSSPVMYALPLHTGIEPSPEFDALLKYLFTLGMPGWRDQVLPQNNRLVAVQAPISNAPLFEIVTRYGGSQGDCSSNLDLVISQFTRSSQPAHNLATFLKLIEPIFREDMITWTFSSLLNLYKIATTHTKSIPFVAFPKLTERLTRYITYLGKPNATAWITNETGTKDKPFIVGDVPPDPKGPWISPKLVKAALNNNVKEMRALFTAGAYAIVLERGSFPLMRAEAFVVSLVHRQALDAIKLLHEKGFPFKEVLIRRRFEKRQWPSAELHFLSLHVEPLLPQLGQVAPLAPADCYSPLLVEAIKTGNVEMVRFLREVAHCSWTYLPKTQLYPLFWYAIEASVNPALVQKGEACDMMDYLFSQNVPFNELSACEGSLYPTGCFAASLCALDALQWLDDHELDLDQPIQTIRAGTMERSAYISHIACATGSIPLIEWIFANLDVDIWHEPDLLGFKPIDSAILHQHDHVLAWFADAHQYGTTNFFGRDIGSYWESSRIPSFKEGSPIRTGPILKRRDIKATEKEPAHSILFRRFGEMQRPVDLQAWDHVLLHGKYAATMASVFPEAMSHEHFDYLLRGVLFGTSHLVAMHRYMMTTPLKIIAPLIGSSSPNTKRSAPEFSCNRAWIEFLFVEHIFSARRDKDFTQLDILLTALQLCGLALDRPLIKVYEKPWAICKQTHLLPINGPVQHLLDPNYRISAATAPDEVALCTPYVQLGQQYVSLFLAAIIFEDAATTPPNTTDAGHHIESDEYSRLGPLNSTFVKLMTIMPAMKKNLKVVTECLVEAACRGMKSIVSWILGTCQLGDLKCDAYALMMHTLVLSQDLDMLEYLVEMGFPLAFKPLPEAAADRKVYKNSLQNSETICIHRQMISYWKTGNIASIFSIRPNFVASAFLLLSYSRLMEVNNGHSQIAITVAWLIDHGVKADQPLSTTGNLDQGLIPFEMAQRIQNRPVMALLKLKAKK